MATLATPTIQTVYNSLTDQSDIQTTAPYNGTPPSVYLTRLLTRFVSAAHSPNTVLWGLNASYSSGMHTNVLTFNISPGALIVDSAIINFPSQFTIATDAIPTTAPSKLKIGIFANFTFNAATADTQANNVSFSSYVFDMTDNLIAPTIFGGTEKILISVFTLDMSGSNIVASDRINDWVEIGNAATLANAANQLQVTNTQAYPGYAYIDTAIPANTQCDFTANVVSGNATVKVGNTVPNSSELVNLTSAVPATLTSPFTTTSSNQTIALGNTNGVVGDVAVFDNVQVEYPSTVNLLTGDDSTFATSIGNWVPSEQSSAYWDGAGGMVIRSTVTDYTSMDFIVGTDLNANTTYSISVTSPTNLTVNVGTGGSNTIDLLNSPITTVVQFTTPSSGTVTITLTMTSPGTIATLADISLFEVNQNIVGDDSTFTASTGTWAAVSSTITAVGATLNVTDTSALASTGHALLNVNVINGLTYTFTFDVVAGSANAFTSWSGSSPTSTTVALVAGAHTFTIVANATGVLAIQLGSDTASGVAVFDNVKLTNVLTANILIGDDSTFASTIGNWVPSRYSATSIAGALTINNMITETAGSEANVTQSIALTANSRYQIEATGLVGGTLQVLDGATPIASTIADGIVKFSTTAATTYTLKYFNNVLTLDAQSTLGQVNLFPRLNALATADSTFTSIAAWKTTAFDNVYYAGNGLRMIDHLAFGAEVSRTISGLTIGTVYRTRMVGDTNAQILIGTSVGNGSLLTATGVVDAIFTATATSHIVTLRVNSNVVNAEASFKDIKIFEDNMHVVQSSLISNSLASNGNLKAVSVNNPTRTLRQTIAVAGHGSYIYKGDDPITVNAESDMVSALDHSIACWMLDIPKMKPTATSLVYHVAEIFKSTN